MSPLAAAFLLFYLVLGMANWPGDAGSAKHDRDARVCTFVAPQTADERQGSVEAASENSRTAFLEDRSLFRCQRLFLAPSDRRLGVEAWRDVTTAVSKGVLDALAIPPSAGSLRVDVRFAQLGPGAETFRRALEVEAFERGWAVESPPVTEDLSAKSTPEGLCEDAPMLPESPSPAAAMVKPTLTLFLVRPHPQSSAFAVGVCRVGGLPSLSLPLARWTWLLPKGAP